MKPKLFAIIFLLLCEFVYTQDSSTNPFNGITVKLGGDLQFQARQFFNQENSNVNGDFFIRRSRLKVTGTYTNYFSYRIMTNFANSKINLQDSYLDFTPISFLQFRLGKFKAPIGLELLQSPGNMAFIERSIVTNFVPNRDLGIIAFGNICNVLDYQIGIMNGIIDGKNGDSEIDNNKELVARVMLSPFNSTGIQYLRKLNIGISFSSGKRNGSAGTTLTPSYVTNGRQTFFKYVDGGDELTTAFASGKKLRYVPQLYLYEGRFGLIGEYAITTEEISLNNSVQEFRNTAWQAAVMFMLTDDNSGYGKVTPKAEFDPTKGNWGALQLVARLCNVSMDEAIFPNFVNTSYSAKDVNSYGVGVNWYLNKYFRLSVNYEKTTFDSGLNSVTINDEDVLIMQTQVIF